MKIKVTQKHIDNGKREGCGDCPVALALNDATGRVWSVGFQSANLKNTFAKIQLPRPVAKRLMAYAHRGELEPFEFELDIDYLVQEAT